MSTKERSLQDIGRDAAECIADMVAALECDYDRLEELREAKADYAKEGLQDFTGDYPDESAELIELEDAAGDCADREDAEQRIHEHPLDIELSGTWSLGETPVADRALILLGTGGPATRIVCELDEHMQPHRAWIEAQDWGTPWTAVHGGVDSDALLTYCQQFYFVW